MRRYHWYESGTGRLSGRTYADNIGDDAQHAAAVEANKPPAHDPVEGVFDHLSQRVDVERLAREDDAAATAWAEHCDELVMRHIVGGEALKKPPPPPRSTATAAHVIDYIPPQPDPTHEWNAETKRWELAKVLQELQRARSQALARIRELQDGQHTYIRRLALNPVNTAARLALEQIESEVSALQALL